MIRPSTGNNMVMLALARNVTQILHDVAWDLAAALGRDADGDGDDEVWEPFLTHEPADPRSTIAA